MKPIKEIPFINTANLAYQSTIGAEDNNSCAVRALAGAFGIDYLIAFNVLANNGRKYKKGTYDHQITKSVSQLCEVYGYSYKEFTVPVKLRVTDIAIANQNNKDITILIFSNRHLTLFKHGALCDSFIDRSFTNHYIILTKNQESEMATDVSKLTTEERSKLVVELSEKLNRDSFIKDSEKESARKLLAMLSKYKAIDAEEQVEEIKTEPIIKLKF